MTVRKVVIVGAGFAKPIGIPTLREALDRFKQLEFGGAWPQEKEEADRVLKAWANHGGDMEQFGKDVEEGKIKGGDPTFRLAFSPVMIRGFELAMQQTSDPSLRLRRWRDFYRPFARAIGQHKEIALVSFNYDLLLEQALLQEGYCPEYHLGKDVIDVNEKFKVGERVSLFKPNGSLNWLHCDNPDCKIVTVKWEKEGGEGSGLPGNWGTGPERHLGHLPNPDVESELKFLLIPPGTKNSPKFPQVESIRNRLKDELARAEEVYFLGWSAPDTDKEWMRDLLSNSKARMSVVNREENSDAVQKLARRFGAVIPERCKVSWYLGEEAGDVSRYTESAWWRQLLKP